MEEAAIHRMATSITQLRLYVKSPLKRFKPLLKLLEKAGPRSFAPVYHWFRGCNTSFTPTSLRVAQLYPWSQRSTKSTPTPATHAARLEYFFWWAIRTSHPGWLWRPPRTLASFLWWCWCRKSCRKRPAERTLRVEERRCPTFSPFGPVSLCCFTIPIDYVTVSLLVC